MADVKTEISTGVNPLGSLVIVQEQLISQLTAQLKDVREQLAKTERQLRDAKRKTKRIQRRAKAATTKRPLEISSPEFPPSKCIFRFTSRPQPVATNETTTE